MGSERTSRAVHALGWIGTNTIITSLYLWHLFTIAIATTKIIRQGILGLNIPLPPKPTSVLTDRSPTRNTAATVTVIIFFRAPFKQHCVKYPIQYNTPSPEATVRFGTWDLSLAQIFSCRQRCFVFVGT